MMAVLERQGIILGPGIPVVVRYRTAVSAILKTEYATIN
jgi:hypothetical protein